jgi:uncharacterized spore protein YtfJ
MVTTMVDKLAERLGARAAARAVYGDPVERGGVTVIPVAKVRYAFGAGGGSGASAKDDASGGGGGGGGQFKAEPLGYIELRDGTAEFKPIRDEAAQLAAVLPIVIASGITTVLILRGLRRLIHN